MFLRSKKAKMLLLTLVLVLAGSGAALKPSLLHKIGVISALHYMGVIADPALQAKIGDLSKQIEDLQKMVTLLIPQQQNRIETLHKQKIEQQQLEQEEALKRERGKEQREREEKEAAEERERRREEEEERQRVEEMRIRELERERGRLEGEIRAKQEEEQRKEEERVKLDEERVRMEEERLILEEEQRINEVKEKLKKAEEELKKAEEEKLLAEEEEKRKQEKEESEKEEAEDDETEDVLEQELDICDAETCLATEEREEPTQKENVEELLTSLQEATEKLETERAGLAQELELEKQKLQEEVRKWEEFKAQEIASALKRSAEAESAQNQPAEQQVNTAAIQEAMEALSRTLLAKMSALEGENEALRVALSQMESGVAADMRSLVQDLEAVKQQVELVKEQILELPPPTVEEIGSSVTDTEAVQNLINNSLQKYAADYVGMPDYALESSGAVVFTIGETEPYTRDTPWMGVFGISIWRSCKTPRLAIQKDNSPGNCWSFTGDKGALTIQLSAQVFPEHFTLDHIPIALAPNQNASSAPYHFRVLGLDYGNAPKGHVLGNYEFTEFPIQTFPVQQNPYEKYFRFIKVEILSNHGNRDYTCLYRFRVHGKPYDTQTFNG